MSTTQTVLSRSATTNMLVFLSILDSFVVDCSHDNHTGLYSIASPINDLKPN